MVNYDYLYDKEYFREDIDVNHFSERELSFKTYKNAYIVAVKGEIGGVYTENKEFINSSALNSGYNPSISSERVIADNYKNQKVIYLGVWSQVWGHAITDVISRLWFLQSRDYMTEYDGIQLVFAYDESVWGG